MVGWWHIMFKRQQPRHQLTLRKGYWRIRWALSLLFSSPSQLESWCNATTWPGCQALISTLGYQNPTLENLAWPRQPFATNSEPNSPIHATNWSSTSPQSDPHTQRNEWPLELYMWELKQLTPGYKHMHQCLQCIAPIPSKRSIHTLVTLYSTHRGCDSPRAFCLR
jgi:hypothetical protein